MKSRSHSVQGLRYFPIKNENDYNVSTTEWRRLIEDDNLPWRFDIAFAVKKAARNKLYSKNQACTPAIGDIVFMDGLFEGSAIVAFGNEKSGGIPGTGRFTHVGIVIAINKDGTALISEGGGPGVLYLRQATMLDMETGHIFRCTDRELAARIAKIACDASKFDREQYIESKQMELRNDGNYDAYYDGEDIPKNSSWKEAEYEACFSAPYSISGMLTSQAAKSLREKNIFSVERWQARHEPGFRKKNSDRANTSFRVYCSYVALYAITMGYLETIQRGKNETEEMFLKRGSDEIEKIFGKELRYSSPKTLYKILLDAKGKDKSGKLFKRVASFINLDDHDANKNQRVRNFRYNGGEKEEHGGRPFKNNTFEFPYDLEEKYIDMAITEPSSSNKPLDDHFSAIKSESLKQLVSLLTALDQELQKIKSGSDMDFHEKLALKLLGDQYEELIHRLSVLKTNIESAVDSDELILCIAESACNKDLGRLIAKRALSVRNESVTYLSKINQGTSPDSFLEEMLNFVVTKQQYHHSVHDKRENKEQEKKEQEEINSYDAVLEILSNQDFWKTRNSPLGINKMRAVLKEFSITAHKDRLGTGSVTFEQDQIFPFLKKIAANELKGDLKSKSLDPDVNNFYQLLERLDLTQRSAELIAFHKKSCQLRYEKKEIKKETLQYLTSGAIARYLELGIAKLKDKDIKNAALLQQKIYEVGSGSDLAFIVYNVISGNKDSKTEYDPALGKMLKQELHRQLGERRFNDIIVQRTNSNSQINSKLRSESFSSNSLMSKTSSTSTVNMKESSSSGEGKPTEEKKKVDLNKISKENLAQYTASSTSTVHRNNKR